MPMIYFDPIIHLKHGFPAAAVFEKVWQMIHRSPDSTDECFEDEGHKWRHFTYLEIHNFFDAETPDGKLVNALGSERTVRRAVDKLVKAGLFHRSSHMVGISLAINFDQLRNTVGDENFTHYIEDSGE